MSTSAVSLCPVAGTEPEWLFLLYETSLRRHIEPAFGWDPRFQQERFSSAYPVERIELIRGLGARCGYVALRQRDDALHVALLLVEKPHQGLGVGSEVMRQIEERAASLDQAVTLSCFRSNERALSFYARRGYRCCGEDRYFLTLRQTPDA